MVRKKTAVELNREWEKLSKSIEQCEMRIEKMKKRQKQMMNWYCRGKKDGKMCFLEGDK